MIVGMDRVFASHLPLAIWIAGSRNHLIYVHVRLRPASRLPIYQGKWDASLPAMTSSQASNLRARFLSNFPKSQLTSAAAFLQDPESLDELRGHQVAAEES